MGSSRSTMDLGHHSLYWGDELLASFAKNQRMGSLALLRIRRDRYETAHSLLFRNSSGWFLDNITDYKWGYYPYHRPEDVLLKPPSREVWESLNPFQTFLWFQDEVEARWQQFLDKYKFKYPNIFFSELYWSNESPGSMGVVAGEVGEWLGARNHSIPLPKKHVKPHAGNASDFVARLPQYVSWDMEYRARMGYR